MAFDAASRLRRALAGVLREEADSGREGVAAVEVGARQLEVDDLAEQLDGQLQQDAGAVAAVGLGTRGAAVLEVLEGQSDRRRRWRATVGPGCR